MKLQDGCGCHVAAQFRVLGAVEADVDGRMVDLGHIRQRSVLAVLLVEANMPVPVDQLADRVWGDQPPRNVLAAIYSYVSKLRGLLSGIDGVEIVRRPGGYVLHVDPLTVDLHRFRDLVARARSADPSTTVDLMDEALGLWRGAPFLGLDAPWLRRARESLLGERLGAELERNDAALERGEHARLLPELSRSAAEHPFDERLAGQLMLALYRCGRQADALDHYDRMRKRLADELGVDPSAALQRLRGQLLAGDPALAGATSTGGASERRRRLGGAGVPAGGDRAAAAAEHAVAAEAVHAQAVAPQRPPWLTVPRQLPAPPVSFIGRADQLAELDRAMSPPRDESAVISTIVGSGGMGKTWLALRWAYDHIDSFDDGQLYLNLRGFDPTDEPLAPEAAMRSLLEALGLSPAAVPAQLDAQSALYRSLTAGRRMLLLLDNARDSNQVIPLLPGGATCAVLVTSRRSLAGLVATHGARPLVLDVLADAEAEELLAGHLGEHRVAAEPSAVAALIRHCGGLPLALGIVAARAALRPEASLATLAAELRGVSTRLDALDAGEVAASLRSVLSCSLSALGDDAAMVGTLLGLSPGPEISLPAVASLVAQPATRARRLLAEVVHAHLAVEATPLRYRMHDLVRLYLGEQARRSAPECREASSRVLDHYLHTARAADDAIRARDEAIPIAPPRPGVEPEPIPDDTRALAWFTAEQQVLVAAVEYAAANGFDSHAWQLAQALQNFLGRRGHWHDLLSTHRIAVAAARRLADPLAQTYAHRGLGNAYVGLGRYDRAHTHLALALEFAAQVDDRACLARAHRGLGRFFARQGLFEAALPYDERARELYAEAGHQVGEASALNAVGWHLAHLGEPELAARRCGQALELYRQLGDRHGQALTWDSLGYARSRLGDHPGSVAAYTQAAEIFGELGHHALKAGTLVALGDACDATGDASGARRAWRAAMRLYADMGDPAAGRVRDRLRR